MPRGFGRLPFLGRRSAGTDASAGLVPAAPRRTLDPDAAPVGPPILMPAAIIRQVLFDSIELTPVWAVRRLGAFATAGAAASGSAATPLPRPPLP
jgi:hypothetical protein